MRTQIIATLGPKSDSPELVEKLIGAGMDIARINFSHCTQEEFRARKEWVLSAASRLGKRVALLQDLRGPRVRVGELPPEGRELRENEEVIFSIDAKDQEGIFIDHADLVSDMKPGETIYLANGEMELLATRIEASRIYAKVVRGGILFSRKAVNLPHTKLSISGITQKDIEDVQFALREGGLDYVAISFVQTADDVRALRALTGDTVKIVAKIETALALKNIDEIIQASDAIMIARGDLGVEMPQEQLPFIQKNLIRHAAWHGKASIVATQMLTSMVNHVHPTRAEVSDIANAVWEGADAVMLSNETASGQYPLESLETMARIVREAERFHFHRPNHLSPGPVSQAAS